ncbi:MAG: hypothetical protein STHCBS139747_002578 [Sporothrix thermara]
MSEQLNEEDYKLVAAFASAEKLLQELEELERNHEKSLRSKAAQALSSMHSSLKHLQTWAALLMVGVTAMGSGGDGDKGSNISLACLWGVIFLMVQLSSYCADDEALNNVSNYLSRLGDDMMLLNRCDPDTVVNESFDFLVRLVQACLNTIRFFRRNSSIRSGTWHTTVQKPFDDLITDFKARVNNLHRLTKGNTQMYKQQQQQQATAVAPAIRLPYFNLKYKPNTSFYGRTDLLSNIQKILYGGDDNSCTGSQQSVPSVAIHGTGGIGKTQIALKYAHMQAQRYEEGMTSDQLRLLMWTWLETTNEPWLLVYDNVDDDKVLENNWPKVNRTNGQILVTCRSEIVARMAADAKIEVPCFTEQQGGQLLLRLADKTEKKTAEDVAVAEELSLMLGGLALAIDILARQIIVKKMTMPEFFKYFLRNKPKLLKPPSHMKNIYYKETLETVWQTAFESLDDASARVLQLLCFCAPDDIPRSMIHRQDDENETVSEDDIMDDNEDENWDEDEDMDEDMDDAVDIDSGRAGQQWSVPGMKLPPEWAFLTDDEAYHEAQELLLSRALIKVNDETGMISLHRLIHEAYYNYMTDAQRHDAFGVMYRLLCAEFPRRTLRRQMYEVWNKCEMLVHHVEMLQNRYEELHGIRGPGRLDVQDLELHTMLADATWFCSETCALQLGEVLGRRAVKYCANKDSLIYAYLCESLATIYHRRGQYQSALKYFELSLTIREKEATTTAPELADAYSAIGLALFGLFRSKESIEWVDKALKVASDAPADQQHTFNIDRYRRNHSRPRAALRDFAGAKEDVAAAEAFQTRIYGADSHFHGETAYILGKIAIEERDWDEAERQLQRAYDLQYPGKPTHQSVASALYHQARLCVLRPVDGGGDEEEARKQRERNDEKALGYLKKALSITQFNEARRGDQGESARVKYKIADILERQGKVQEAATYRADAVAIKKKLEATKRYPKAPDEDQEWDCFSDLVDR